jgi:heptosyltransferase-3
MTPAPKTILIVNIRLIGDVILTTPLIGLLKDAYPGAAIDLLVNRGTGEFLEKDPRVRTVIYSCGNESAAGQGKEGYLGMIFRCYDLAINMNASDRGNFAVLMAGKRMRVGFYNSGNFWKSLWQKLLLTHPLRFPEQIPVARYCQVVAQALEIPHTRLTVKVYWDDADETRVNSILEERGADTPFFVVHPFARWIYKYWRFEGFAAVSDQIFERYGLRPVWTSSASAEEKKQLVEAAGICRHKPVIIGGELTLNQMTCLLGRANFYLGLDTAISHLAASTGIPLVALYGPTFTNRWFPWYNNGPIDQECPEAGAVLRLGNIVVVRKEMECVPCGKAGCDDSGRFQSPCIQEISVDEVLAAVDTCLRDVIPGGGN